MFNILDYVSITSEIATEYTAECPKCGGKLKIKKDNKAYLCVASACTPKQIRSCLKVERKEYTRYVEPVIEPRIITSGSFVSIDDLSAYLTTVKKENVTYFKYSDNFAVKRIDHPPKEGKKNKVFYPYYRINDKWLDASEVSQQDKIRLSCFYKQDLLSTTGIILVVEGEKCADFAIANLGIQTTTAVGFGWSVEWLAHKLRCLKPAKILVLPDHDEAGKRKAYLLQKECWKQSIECNVFFEFSVFSETTDIADLDNEQLNKLREKLSKWF